MIPRADVSCGVSFLRQIHPRGVVAVGTLILLSALLRPGHAVVRAQTHTSGRAENQSYRTTCAEEDNVNVPIWAGRALAYRIVATHPTYPVGADNCREDFSGCGVGGGPAARSLLDVCQTLFDDGLTVVQACTVPGWWRPYSTQIVAPGGSTAVGHYLVLYRKITGEPSWPQILVLYEDGNLRLKPHPPEGVADTCFGSSVVVGPAVPARRPFIDIERIQVNATPLSLDLTYRDGRGAAHMDLAADRSRAVATIRSSCDLPADSPFATFRSMWVQDGNADVDHVQNAGGGQPILGNWTDLTGPSWFFHRRVRSLHNASAPDILVEVTDVPAELAISVNSTVFRPGDTMVVTGTALPGTGATSADVYVSVELPGSVRLFLQPDGSTTPAVRPFASNWTVSSIRGDLLRYTFSGNEPLGGYRWNADFTTPGTLLAIGCTGQSTFAVTR